MSFGRYELHEAMELRHGELPFTKPITPAEMRVGLSKTARYNPVLGRVSNMAEMEGWTGEDKYTALAFYAMLQWESMQASYFRYAELSPSHPFFIDRAKKPEQNGK